MKLSNNQKQNVIKSILISIALLSILTIEVYARAGGGGGHSSGGGSYGGSSSGSGGDGIGLLIMLIFHLPFPLNIIVVGILIYAGYTYYKKKGELSIFNEIPSVLGNGTNSYAGHKTNQNILNKLPSDVKSDEFITKVKKAFIDIQNAWQKQDLKDVRKFISDGVYQRFTTQFLMIKKLHQQNIVENINIQDCSIVDVDNDGLFTSVTVQFVAKSKDKFESKLYPNLNETFNNTFIEYWTFIRKMSNSGGNLYTDNSCPHCGAELSNDMGEVSKCKYCLTILNNGDYDWVLSEITQADDYIINMHSIATMKKVITQTRHLREVIPSISLQVIEDKASNIFFQIKGAEVLQKPEQMRRFVADTLYEKKSGEIKNSNYVYNRLYINSADVIAYEDVNESIVAHVRIKYSYQQVRIANSKATTLQNRVMSKTEVLLLEQKKQFKESKGNLLSHECPACGAPIEDTTSVECGYCGTAVNSTDYDWILKDIQTSADSINYLYANKSSILDMANLKKDSKTLSVRDYILNNVACIVAADGVIDSSELEFMNKLAKQYGYNSNKIASFIEFAQQGKLSIKMPNTKLDIERVYKKMEEAAMADGALQDEEREILDQVKNEYLH